MCTACKRPEPVHCVWLIAMMSIDGIRLFFRPSLVVFVHPKSSRDPGLSYKSHLHTAAWVVYQSSDILHELWRYRAGTETHRCTQLCSNIHVSCVQPPFESRDRLSTTRFVSADDVAMNTEVSIRLETGCCHRKACRCEVRRSL